MQVDWPNVNGHRVQSQVYGYYFELDWGIQHHRVPSLMYIQMYDPYDVMELAPKGHVKVVAKDSFHACVFSYDFTKSTSSNQNDFVSRKLLKKYVRERKTPTLRIEAQDMPFSN